MPDAASSSWTPPSYPVWDCNFCLYWGGRHLPFGAVVECRCDCHDAMYQAYRQESA